MNNVSCIRQKADIQQIGRCKEIISIKSEEFENLSNGLAMIGNSVRLKLLYLLNQEKRLCVCDLSDILGISISAVSQHLRKLKDRKIIQAEKEAQTIYYSLNQNFSHILQPLLTILDEETVKEIA
jgi:DNA-binding transcriptional ArsR family regulator